MFSCESCENLHDATYGSGRFCCFKCSKKHSDKTKLKIRLTLTKIKDVACPVCGVFFHPKKRTTVCCSRHCSMVNRNRNFPSIAQKAGLISSSKHSKRSKNEVLFAEYCKEYFASVDTNLPIFEGWDADIIIHDLMIAVLWNGKWHYEKIGSMHSLSQVQTRDKIKEDIIFSCGYTPYIIQDMGKYNPDFVYEEFLIFKHLVSQCD